MTDRLKIAAMAMPNYLAKGLLRADAALNALEDADYLIGIDAKSGPSDVSEMAATITRLEKAVMNAMVDRQCAHKCDGPHHDCPFWYCECFRALEAK